MKQVLLTALIAVNTALALTVFADELSRTCISSGGGLVSGGGYTLQTSTGQNAAGFVSNAGFVHWVGFWAGEVPRPEPMSALSSAKLVTDGWYIGLSGKIATSGIGDFSDFFYVEEPGRSSGLRIARPPECIPSLTRGSVVNLIGTLATMPTGERMLAGPTVVITAPPAPLQPLGMINRAVGGACFGDPSAGRGQYGISGASGLNNIGLLIKSWGRVVEVGSDHVVINDGSSAFVRVSTAGVPAIFALDDFVTVVGLSSIYKPASDRERLVLPRTPDDIKGSP